MSVREATSAQVTRRSFTVAEYERMGEIGIFSEDDRVELVNGEVIEMSPVGERHAGCVGLLTQLITLLLQRGAVVWVQNPILLDDHSEPQPDVAVLKPRAGIPEVWVVNLPEERVETYSDPAGGAYQTANSYARGDELQAHSPAALRLSASEVLG